MYSFKNFTDLSDQESAEVLQGRNDPIVRTWMTSDKEITPEEHVRFMSMLKCSNRSFYVRIDREGYFVGVYSLNDISGGSARGGFWVSAFARERHLPLNVVFQGMDYMFRVFGINHIYGFQKFENHSAIKLNSLLGLNPNLAKSTDTKDLLRIEITQQQWVQNTRQNMKLLKLMDRIEKLNGTT